MEEKAAGYAQASQAQSTRYLHGTAIKYAKISAVNSVAANAFLGRIRLQHAFSEKKQAVISSTARKRTPLPQIMHVRSGTPGWAFETGHLRLAF